MRIEDPFSEVKYLKRENQRQPLNKMPSDSEGLSKQDAATRRNVARRFRLIVP
jgi:hypothetical protein